MSIISANCPRCGDKNTTFGVKGNNLIKNNNAGRHWYELFAVCRSCREATIFIIFNSKGITNELVGFLSDAREISLNRHYEIERFISLRDNIIHRPPNHIPDPIKAVFEEGAACFSIECWNATGAMFRTCLDLASKDKIQGVNEKDITKHQRENMAARIEWLFDKKKLPDNLKELADCIRQDGNDGAHDGTLGKDEADDLLDFTIQILEHFYTQPAKAEESRRRRAERKAKTAPAKATPSSPQKPQKTQ